MIPYLLAATGRLDWGMGNPNKAGALIVLLIPLLWGLHATLTSRLATAPTRRITFLGAWGATLALTVCLLLTESRGALLAAVFVGLILAGFAKRPWNRKRAAALALLIPLAIAAGAHLGVMRRMDPDYAAGDPSVRNRLRIWKNAPQMIADAPAGWGAGRAGPEYGRWYQEPENTQNYRVLVSGHLTRLAELSDLARWSYIAGWLAVLSLAWRRARRTGEAWPLALLAGQAVAWQFSDVNESPWVFWPTLAGASRVIARALCDPRSRREARLPVIAAALAAAGLIVTTRGILAGSRVTSSEGDGIRLHGSGTSTVVALVFPGATTPSPREWRDLLRNPQTRPDLVWKTDDRVPPVGPVSRMIVFNAPERPLAIPPGVTKLDLIAPRSAPEIIVPKNFVGAVRVHFGEFGAKPRLEQWRRVARVIIHDGEGDYLPNWPIFTTNGD